MGLHKGGYKTNKVNVFIKDIIEQGTSNEETNLMDNKEKTMNNNYR